MGLDPAAMTLPTELTREKVGCWAQRRQAIVVVVAATRGVAASRRLCMTLRCSEQPGFQTSEKPIGGGEYRDMDLPRPDPLSSFPPCTLVARISIYVFLSDLATYVGRPTTDNSQDNIIIPHPERNLCFRSTPL